MSNNTENISKLKAALEFATKNRVWSTIPEEKGPPARNRSLATAVRNLSEATASSISFLERGLFPKGLTPELFQGIIKKYIQQFFTYIQSNDTTFTYTAVEVANGLIITDSGDLAAVDSKNLPANCRRYADYLVDLGITD